MNFNKLKNGINKLKDIAPSTNVLQEVIGANTLAEIRQGKVLVTDKLLNDIIANKISKIEDSPLTGMELASHADGKISIKATLPKIGAIALTGFIENFRINKDTASLVYHVEEHKITDYKIVSWLFSQVSLGLLYRFIGDIDLPDTISVKVDGDKITADVTRLLMESPLGKVSINSITALDLLEIESAVARDGGIEFATKLKALDAAKEKIKSLLEKDGGAGQ